MSGRVYEIYRMLEPKPKELLDNPRRQFLKEGPVILWNDVERKKKDRVFFMFNDTLLIAKRLNGSKPKYRLRVYITLRPQVKVVDVEDSHDPCEFRIIAPTKTFVLFGRSREDKRNWIRWIRNTTNGRPYDERDDGDKKKAAGGGAKANKGGSKGRKTDLVESEDESGSYESESYEEDEAEAEAEPESEEEEEEEGSFEEASTDDEDDGVIKDNPDVESFVPVLPDQFFTPSSAKAGVRVGGRRRAGTGAAANRRRGTGAIVPNVERKQRSQTMAAPPAPAAQQAAPQPQQAQSSGLGDLLTFDDPVPQQQQQQNPFGGMAHGGQPAQMSIGDMFGSQPMQQQQPFMGVQQPQPQQGMWQNPFGGSPQQPQQQQQQNPFGGFGQPQQQQQNQNPFF